MASPETEAPQSSKPETKEPEAVDSAVPTVGPPAAKGLMLSLENDRYLVYNKFQGTNRVHIREYGRKNGVPWRAKLACA